MLRCLSNVQCLIPILTLLLLAGCATSTVESRKQEKLSSYQDLPPEFRSLVDQGQVKVGMPADAVYIAWGPPAEILQSETEKGASTTWLYHGSKLEEYRFWNFREVRHGDRILIERFIDHDYYPRHYISAEIVFVDGKVKSWRTLPVPY